MNSKTSKIVIAGFDNTSFKTAIVYCLSKSINKKFNNSIQIADCNYGDLQLKNLLNTTPIEEKSIEIKFPKIKVENCNFCEDCIEVCDSEAISMDKMMNEIEIIKELCIACNDCTKVCKKDAIDYEKPCQIGKLIKYSTEDNISLIELNSETEEIYPRLLVNAIKENIVNNKFIIFDTLLQDITFFDIIENTDYLLFFVDVYPVLDYYIDILEQIDKKIAIVAFENNPDIENIKAFAKKHNYEFVHEIPFKPEVTELKTNDVLNEFLKYPDNFDELTNKIFAIS